MSLVQMARRPAGRLRRYPAKNGGKATVVRRVAKFAEAKCSILSTSSIRKSRGKAPGATVRKAGYVCLGPHRVVILKKRTT
jgi:hypothetical protein